MNVDHEIGLLITELQRLGAPSAAHDGKVAVRCFVLRAHTR
jgi:hypothetical protein